MTFKIKDMKGVPVVGPKKVVTRGRYEKMPLGGKGSEKPSTAKGGKTYDNT